jgi:hypothetical protein
MLNFSSEIQILIGKQKINCFEILFRILTKLY